MININEVATSLRLRRHFYLCRHGIHPLCNLIEKLQANIGYLGAVPQLDIDEIVTVNSNALTKKRKKDCEAPDWQVEADLILHSNLATAKINELVRVRKRQSAEMFF